MIFKVLCIITALVAISSADFKDTCLQSHNKLRALHLNTPALVWDASLAAAAQRWANHLARTRSFQHDSSREKGIGENLFSASGPTKSSCAVAILAWYHEYKYYNYGNPLGGSTGVIGHFTQVVWKSSMRVGVAIGVAQYNGNTHSYIVARYSPAGNLYSNQAYTDNVQPRKPGAVVPTKFELDPSLCSNASGANTCGNYNRWGFCKPSSTYYKYMSTLCAKACKLC